MLRSVINSLEGRVCILATDGSILGTNDQWDADTAADGVPAALGGVGGDFFGYCASAPAGLGEMSAEVAGTMRQVLRDGGLSRSVKGQVRVGDEQRWVVVRMHPIERHEQARAMLNAIDITAGMRTQEELRQTMLRAELRASALTGEKELLSTVLSAIPHLVYWKDAELRYLGCNQAFLDFRALSEVDQVVGRAEDTIGAGSQHVTGELGELLTCLERRVIETGAPVVDSKATVPDADGRPRSLLLSMLTQLPGQPAGEVAVIGVAADVTHVSELERQVAQATRLESIGQLAAGIAHEINTPVQYVSDNTRFVAESITGLLAAAGAAPPDRRADLDLEFLAEEVPAALTQSLEGLERVTQIVRAMKDFSHPGQGLAETDLNRAVESAVQVGRNEWKYVSRLSLDLDPRVGLVSCFEGELKQAVLNVIVNAAQAIGQQIEDGTRPGQGTIAVCTRRDGDDVQIVITDDGPGMDEVTRSRVFDPFFTTKAVGRGTGQGLSLAHATIVQKHGGTLEVRSAPGHGTTFTIGLPAAPPSGVAATDVAAAMIGAR